LTREKYATDLSGEGAKLYGGRWNSKGNALVYTSSSRALAVLEVLVNVDKRFLPNDMVMISIELSNSLISNANDFPKNWRTVPTPRSTQIWGDRWLPRNELAIMVPSIVVTQEMNVLLNPSAADFNSQVSISLIEPFAFDSRLF
jgi:RES domain-containing protein